jgi:hypothetical protein
MSDATHTCDRKGPPTRVVDESGDEPINAIYLPCSMCSVPQGFTEEEPAAARDESVS